MVESNLNDTLVPAIQNALQLTEHERRIKRAARFGLDSSTVVGPSSLAPTIDKIDLPISG